MRLLAIPALLLLALAGAALAPSSAAAPPAPSCNGVWATTQTVGPVTVFASPPCYEVSVAAMSCPIAGSWKEVVHVQQVVVRVYTCDSPDPASGDAAAMAPPCTCPPPPQCHQAWTTGPIDAIASVTLTSDCRVIVEILHQTVACTEPLDGTWVITQGRVTVIAPCRPQFDPCEPPFECYPEASGASAVLIPPVCIWKEAAVGPVKAGVDQCRQDHETYASCSSAQRIHIYRQVAYAYVQADVCFPHSPPPDLSASASDPGPCGLQQRCPAPVGLCSGVNDQAEVSGPAASAVPSPVDGITVSDHCQVDVYLGRALLDPSLSCLFGEQYNEFASVGPVTIWLWGCSPPTGPASTMMADPFPTCVRECSPLPASSCELREATPAPLQAPLWGYDCTLDVETACLGGASDAYEADVGFVHVSLAKCDTPDWS